MDTRNRYYTLDAMRGIAAIAVALSHVGMDLTDSFRGGFLAVDFFFLLSGFVIAKAYGGQLAAGMPASDFFRIRLIRLYPLYLVGLALGILLQVGRVAMQASHALDWHTLVPTIAFNLFMLPTPLNIGLLFPLNSPSWSLFFEMAINIAFAIGLFRVKSVWLLLLSAVGLAWLLVGTFAYHPQAYGADIGWEYATFGFGLARVSYTFLLGVVAARLIRHSHRQSWFCIIPMLLLGTLLITDVSIAAAPVRDTIALVVLIPAIFIGGAFLEVPPALRKAAALLGDISYPLYAVHWPLLKIFSFIALKRFHASPVVVETVFLIIALTVSWLLLTWFDAPVRKWLRRQAQMPPQNLPLPGTSKVVLSSAPD